MQVWVRFLIVWCIALALPLQGIASVTMAHCGPSHGDRHAAQAASAHHDHASHAASAAHHHDEAGQSQPDPLSDLALYKCSACAACCAAFALPSAVLQIPQPPAMDVAFAEEGASVEPCAFDGPDRPPRPLLA